MALQIQTTAAERLAEFALGLRYDDLPDELVAAATHHLLDTVGCGLAAHALREGGAGRTVAVGTGGAAEARGTDGHALVAALVAGNGTTARIGAAASGGVHARGFHPTALAGVFGAAVAAARLGGLDRDTDNPITEDAIRAKFRDNAGLAIGTVAVAELEAALLADDLPVVLSILRELPA